MKNGQSNEQWIDEEEFEEELERELPPAACGCSWNGPAATCEEGRRLFAAIPDIPLFDEHGDRFYPAKEVEEEATDRIFEWLAHIDYPGF